MLFVLLYQKSWRVVLKRVTCPISKQFRYQLLFMVIEFFHHLLLVLLLGSQLGLRGFPKLLQIIYELRAFHGMFLLLLNNNVLQRDDLVSQRGYSGRAVLLLNCVC